MIKKVFDYENNKPFIFYILGLFLIIGVVVMLSLGWATFSNKLELDDISTIVKANIDIRITDLIVDDTINNSSSSLIEFSPKRIQSDISLPNEDSKITFKIDITNFGNIEMGVLDITGLPDNLEYSLSNYDLEDKICDDSREFDKCKNVITKDVYLTIGYKDNCFNPDDVEFSISLDFDFRPFHNVTYLNLDGDNLPSEIIDGSNLSVTFSNNVHALRVFENDIRIFDYSLIDNTFNLSNVIGDLSINLAPYIFNASINKTEVGFTKETENIILSLSNYNDDDYDDFDIEYEVIIPDNPKVTISYDENDLNGILSSGKSSKEIHIKVTPIENSSINLVDNFAITVKTKSPIMDTKAFNIRINRRFYLVGEIEGGYHGEIDCSSVPNYQNLTEANFLFDVQEVNVPGNAHGLLEFVKSYNPVTGILTIDRPSVTGNGIITFKGQIYATTEGRELVRKDGVYVTEFDCTMVENYHEKIMDDFVIDLIQIDIPTSEESPDGVSGRMVFTKNYDAEKGIFTVNRTSIYGPGILIHPLYAVYGP